MGKNMKKSRKRMLGGEPSDSGATDGESSSNYVSPAQGVPIESVTPPVGVPPTQGAPVAQAAPAEGKGVWGTFTGLFSSKEDYNAEIKTKQEEITELRRKQAAEAAEQKGGRRRSNKKRTRRTKKSRRSRRHR